MSVAAPKMSEHPQDLSLRAQARAIASGDLDATELLEATLARIEERDPLINSVADHFASESARMLAEAPEGPLHGVPVGVKDQFALPWRAPRDGAFKSPFGIEAGESGVFRRLRDAGAVIVAVTNMHEFGLGSTGHISAYGPCGNPWDPSRCAGGSSSGSAAAVSARLVAGAVGTDGGGSIRFPSGYCGVTGLKLTWGQIPIDGFTHGHLSLGTAGPICRDAADARLIAEALLARRVEAKPASGLRLGVPRDQLWTDLDPEVEEACAAGVNLLRDAGVEVEEVSLAGAEHTVIATVLPLAMEGLPSEKPGAMMEIAPHLSPLVRALGKYQLLTPGVALLKAERVRAQLRRSLAQAFERVDALAWPALPAPSPPIEEPTVSLPSGQYPADYANVRLGGIANLTGVPAASLPCGFSGSGLPIGLQLLAPWGEDGRVLDIGELLERATERRFVDATPPLAAKTTA
jgi:Asp-tRNA(Asn)/Glu-tRNA(Gln) amidotransferase A subunit family amidase